MISKLIKAIVLNLSAIGCFDKMSDEKYLKLCSRIFINEKLNLEEPKTFNEKMQWLKLNYTKDNYNLMVDKYEAKKYVNSIVGDEIIIPTLGLYEKVEDIDFQQLPNKFVIKCTHDSGGIVICTNKERLDTKKTAKKLISNLKKDYYRIAREWPYKNVKPRIIIEEYMEEENKQDLKDYKFFCFNGEPKFVLVCSERFSSSNMKKTFFDENWNVMDVKEGGHQIDVTIKRPVNFDKMKEIAKKLSKDMPFLRVDLYEINGKIYFGEMTFYPNAGFEKFEPEEFNRKLGDLINIDKIKEEKQ